MFASVNVTPSKNVLSAAFTMNAVNAADSIALSTVNVAKSALNSNVASSADNTNSFPSTTSGPVTLSTGLTITSIVRETSSAPSVAVNVNGNVPPVTPAATIAASSSAFTAILVISLSIVTKSGFNTNALTSANVLATASVNVFASAFSNTNPVAEICKFPSVVEISSDGLTMNVTVFDTDNVPSVTVNVISNDPPVFVTALNASN